MFKVHTKSEFISSYQAGVRNFQHAILTAVNLTGNNLEQIDLSGSNLIEVNCTNCNLNRASLEKAYLGLSNFQNCCLSSVNFREANLEQADLSRADLTNADLSRANLKQANLKGANLEGAKLDNACLIGAVYNSTTVFDSHFVPQQAGMIASESQHTHSIKSASKESQDRRAIDKIMSWCRSPKFNPQTQR